ncbi:MAG: putative multidrug export ATP-binding/permease protein [Luteibacter sp.]|uniref:ABC transporter ATP-binding protein n=1 Tax=Luteibacter sp. TaxID=1886636 RepID=UPI001385EE00|nr:ABC transporter ATP-binding protein [Luteibacter sp.]KAF1003473.1 MAG: putative multidrug export ATP-binding/permease protein [Luteibacter sp.]
MSASADDARLHTPHWRIEDTPADTGGAMATLRRLSMSVRPVLSILRRAAPWSAATVLVSQLGSGIATAGSLVLAADILRRLIEGRFTLDVIVALAPPLLVLAVVQAVRVALDAVTARARARLSPKVHRLAEEQLLAAGLDVQLSAFDDPDFYDQLHRAKERGILHLETATASVVDLLSSLVSVGGATLALAVLHPFLPVLMLLALWPEAWATLRAASLQYAAMATTITLTRQARLIGDLAMERDAAAELRVTQARDHVTKEFGQATAALEAHLVQQGLAEARAATWGHVFAGLGQWASYIALAAMLHAGWIGLAVAGTAIMAMRSAAMSVQRLVVVARELFEKGLYISDYRGFLDTAGRRRNRSASASGEAPASPGDIAVERVTFRYAGAPSNALDDVSLRIARGESIALVGENGSGKTTLAKLIAGLYEPERGCVRWDGLNLRELSAASIADRVAMVLQEPLRWPRSARENVRLGRHTRVDDHDEALLAAAREAGADEVVARLERGWETLLSRQFHGGQELSGGQWQRMAIARGLYRDARLVIWDEPTSSLDAKAEFAVYESLRRMARDRTVVLITHRLASIRHADRICFMERGRIVEKGTHDQLLALGGRYAEMFTLQARLM